MSAQLLIGEETNVSEIIYYLMVESDLVLQRVAMIHNQLLFGLGAAEDYILYVPEWTVTSMWRKGLITPTTCYSGGEEFQRHMDCYVAVKQESAL